MKLNKLLAIGTILTLSLGVLTVNASETDKTPDAKETKQMQAIVETKNVDVDELDLENSDDIFTECIALDDYELSLDEFKDYLVKDADTKALEAKIEEIKNLEVQLTKAYDDLYSNDNIDWDKYYDDLYGDVLYDWDMDFEEDMFELNLEDIPTLFEDSKEFFKKDLSADTLKKAEELFTQAITLEIEGKFDESMKIWDAFDNLDIYDDSIFDYDFEVVE